MSAQRSQVASHLVGAAGHQSTAGSVWARLLEGCNIDSPTAEAGAVPAARYMARVLLTALEYTVLEAHSMFVVCQLPDIHIPAPSLGVAYRIEAHVPELPLVERPVHLGPAVS